MGAVSSTGVGDSQEYASTKEPVECLSCCNDLPPGNPKVEVEELEPQKEGNPAPPGVDFSSNKKTTSDNLPDEVLIKILEAVSASAEKPADVVAPSMICRRWRFANADKEVRRRTSRQGVGIRPKNWGEGAIWFLQRLCDAGCLEACFMLGMILFYCIPGGQLDGGRLLLHSAQSGHAASLHNLGIMSFNGSGMNPPAKDCRSGLALCAKAAALGNVEAMREVGLCLLDGFGVQKNTVDGWRLLLKAHIAETGFRGESDARVNAVGSKRSFSGLEEASKPTKRNRVDVFGNSILVSKDEQAAAVSQLMTFPPLATEASATSGMSLRAVVSNLVRGLRSARPAVIEMLRPTLQELETPQVDIPVHPAHAFISEWFHSDDDALEETFVHLTGKGLTTVRTAHAGKCSRPGCARREVRPMEFWRCAGCWDVKYCSRLCQVHDWNIRHNSNCRPVEMLIA